VEAGSVAVHNRRGHGQAVKGNLFEVAAFQQPGRHPGHFLLLIRKLASLPKMVRISPDKKPGDRKIAGHGFKPAFLHRGRG
jgi:hypothetical protein